MKRSVKKFPDLKFFSLILAEKPLFFPELEKVGSLISLIGGNPAKHTFKLMTLKKCDPSIVVSSPTCGCIRKCFVTLSKFDKRIYTGKKVNEMRQPLLFFSFT